MSKTKISWTDETWNPIVGCSVVSPGCTNCYAMRMAGTRLRHTPAYRGLTQGTRHQASVWNGKVRFLEERLTQPLRWRKPRRVFVNSMSDLFHENVADDWIDRIFAVMALTSQHTYQVLTKRPERMRDHVSRLARSINPLEEHARNLGHTFNFEGHSLLRWPIPNIWLGTSVEDQRRADERIPALLDTPAAVRFLSCEPLLGPVNLDCYEHIPGLNQGNAIKWLTLIDWVIIGGESGPHARPFWLAWARSIIEQCRSAGVPVFVKQLGARPILDRDETDSYRIRDRKGGDMSEWPDDLKVREFPA